MTGRSAHGGAAGRERSDEELGPALEFLRLLWAVDHALQKASRRMVRRLGVSGPQRFVLRMVGERPGTSPGELAELLHLHRSSVTPLLESLCRRGLLLRRPHPTDGRRAMLWLTPRGSRVDAHRSGTIESAVRGALDGATRERLDAARQLLARLERDLDPSRSRPARKGRGTGRGR